MSSVIVYWDSNRKCWSIKDRKTGRVMNFRDVCGVKTKVRRHVVVLKDCEFRVSKSGRQKVIDTGRKNVHAGVAGSLVGSAALGVLSRLTRQVRYNPYEQDYFFTVDDGRPIYQAAEVLLLDGKVFIAKEVAEWQREPKRKKL